MYKIFTTSKNNLHVFFSSLLAEDIRSCTSLSIFRRGEDYFESDCVSQVSYNKEMTQLRAIVNGSFDYKVQIVLDDGKVFALCTCPDEGVCKHLIATMLYVADYDSEVEIENDENEYINEDMFYEYLQTLSKKELVDLVKKFAPDVFRIEIKNKFANADYAKNTLQKVKKNIGNLFENRYLMNDYGDFNNELDNELSKLSGLEKSLNYELEEFLFQIMQMINDAIEKDELCEYDDDYGYEPSSFFKDFFTGFVTSLDTVKKIAFLAKLDGQLEKQSYSTFDCMRDAANTAFNDSDLPYLKDALTANCKTLSLEMTGKYYDRVHNLLSYTEKTAILEILSEQNSERVVELAALHDTHGELSKAIETLNCWLAENHGSYFNLHEDVYSMYLDLLKKKNGDISKDAEEIIVHCPTHTMLTKIISLTDLTDGNAARYEVLLEHNNAGEILRYLQNNDRLPEALELIKRKPNISESLQNEFFRTYKNLFPEEATYFFSRVIQKNLQKSGDHYYEIITNAIRQMMMVNPIKANEYLYLITTKYKRRTNMMKMLNRL